MANKAELLKEGPSACVTTRRLCSGHAGPASAGLHCARLPNASARKSGFALANEPRRRQRIEQAARSARLGIASNRVRGEGCLKQRQKRSIEEGWQRAARR